jgi:hypothetical protein
MRSMLTSIITTISLLFVLTGCNHYELPFLTDKTKSRTKNSTSTVDVNGVGDDVTSQKIVIKRIAFPEDEYALLKTTGNSTIKGVVAVTYNGQQILGKQTRLYLNPVTTYSNQWYRESYLGGHKMGKSDSRLFNYIKFTASNSNGQFAFYGVAKGSYYVVGTVQCAECGGRNIRIARKVTVNGDNTVTIDLGKSL